MEKNELIQSGILEEYVLGLSSPEKKLLVEQMAEEHQDIADLLGEMRGAMDKCCDRAKDPPPGTAKRRMLASIAMHSDRETLTGVPHLANSKSKSEWSPMLVASLAGIGIVCCMSLFYWWKGKVVQNELQRVSSERDFIREKHKSLMDQYAVASTLLNLVNDHNTMQFQMLGTDISPEACATLYINPKEKMTVLGLIDPAKSG